MDYRDERDALRARVESLEGEIASARADLGRLAAAERELAEARRENEKLRAELGRLAPGRPPKQGPLVAVITLSGVAAAILASAVAAVTLRSRGEAAGAPADTGLPFLEVDAPLVPREVQAAWPARVTRAQGLSFAEGAPCAVRATLRSNGRTAGVPDVEITCSGKTLYRSTDALAGTSTMSYRVEEAPGPDEGSYRAALSYDDQGPRTGERAQASVNSIAGVAIAWRDTAPSYRVELALDELSGAWTGRALLAADEARPVSFRAVFDRTGRAAVVDGFALVPSGAPCEVRVRPAFADDQNCRVGVRCGGASLYGGEEGGFATCIVEDGRPIVAKDTATSDRDRDPMIEVNLAQGIAEVRDARPDPWSVKITLDGSIQ